MNFGDKLTFMCRKNIMIITKRIIEVQIRDFKESGQSCVLKWIFYIKLRVLIYSIMHTKSPIMYLQTVSVANKLRNLIQKFTLKSGNNKNGVAGIKTTSE